MHITEGLSFFGPKTAERRLKWLAIKARPGIGQALVAQAAGNKRWNRSWPEHPQDRRSRSGRRNQLLRLRSDQGLSSHTDLHVRARVNRTCRSARSAQAAVPDGTLAKGEPVTGWRLALNRAPFLAGDQTLYAIVLGAAAGGGFPQWNSNAPGCNRARSSDPAAPARTQASLAVSGRRLVPSMPRPTCASSSMPRPSFIPRPACARPRSGA
jgi:hypothetical protein